MSCISMRNSSSVVQVQLHIFVSAIEAPSICMGFTTPVQNTPGSKKEPALESNWEQSRALVMLYTGADARYGSKLSSFVAYGRIWCRSGLYWHVPDCRSKWWFLRSELFVLNFWLHLAPWIYCTHHKLSRTGLRVAGAYLHPALSRIVAQSELN